MAMRKGKTAESEIKEKGYGTVVTKGLTNVQTECLQFGVVMGGWFLSHQQADQCVSNLGLS
jgi:hypothetical protein